MGWDGMGRVTKKSMPAFKINSTIKCTINHNGLNTRHRLMQKVCRRLLPAKISKKKNRAGVVMVHINAKLMYSNIICLMRI